MENMPHVVVGVGGGGIGIPTSLQHPGCAAIERWPLLSSP